MKKILLLILLFWFINQIVISQVYIDSYQTPELIANAGNDTIICNDGEAIVLGGFPIANGGSGAYTYLWSPSTGLSSDVVANPLLIQTADTVSYVLMVTDNNECTSFDTVTVILEDCLLVSENNLYNTISLYPNITDHYIKLNIVSNILINEEVQIVIFDYTGKQVYNNSIIISNLDYDEIINVEKLKQGMYYMQILSSKSIIVKRFIKI